MSDRLAGQHFDALAAHRDRRLVFRLLAWRSGSVRLDLIAVLLAAGLAAACEQVDRIISSSDDTRSVSPTGPTESGGIVVESAELKSSTDCGSAGCFDSCHVRGGIRNDTATNRKVTLKFAVFDKDGKESCFLFDCSRRLATNENGGELVVPAGGRSKYRADLPGCDSDDRLEITELKSEPVA